MKPVITFILPTYKETKSVHQLILDLHKASPDDYSIIIVDDSPNNHTVEYCENAFNECGWKIENIEIIKNSHKGGRGHAVKMGLELALRNPLTNCFVEMDSDGSHSAEMALKVAVNVPHLDFCIGSRYLRESKIIGWSLERRIFSKAINSILRGAFNSEISDWTNGLRAYSRSATRALCEHQALTTGFIYLSEQAVILTNGNYQVGEVPIIFQNRTFGESTVTVRELSDSLLGVFRILRNKSQLTLR